MSPESEMKVVTPVVLMSGVTPSLESPSNSFLFPLHAALDNSITVAPSRATVMVESLKLRVGSFTLSDSGSFTYPTADSDRVSFLQSKEEEVFVLRGICRIDANELISFVGNGIVYALSAL